MNTLTRRLALILPVTASLFAAGLGAWYALRGDPPPATPSEQTRLPEPDPPTDDPRLTFATPFRNVKPDVQYVGDASCAVCHAKIDHTFHAHPMGRSAEYVTQAPSIEKYDVAAHNPTNVGPFELKVEQTAKGVRHRVRALESGGPPLPEYVVSADLAIGSGTRGRSYLTIEDGSVWQTPISWFGPDARWDLSPGFDLGTGGRRAIIAECLFCHVDRVEPVPQSLNRYREPLLPLQASIGCERCHGPGSIHVAERASGPPPQKMDTSIVNPKHLAPELRSAICEQCHLQGEERVARRGRDIFEFRPGLPFELFVTVYVRHPDVADLHHSVGQFEQMEQSRCFLWSNGRFGCTSCHDPHEVPAVAAKDRFYNGKCMSCHESKGCTAPQADRAAKDDSCITCHMPRAASTNITHASVTDHRVPRRPLPAVAGSRSMAPGTIPLVPFRSSPYTPPEPERDRDMGIALGKVTSKLPPGASGPRTTLANFANSRLLASLQRWPGDAEAWVALSTVRGARGEIDARLDAATAAVHLSPNKETAVAELAEAATAAGRFDVAEDAATRLITMSPHAIEPRLSRAMLHMRRKDWARAEVDCRAALAIHPLHPPARLFLAICLHKQGDTAGGRKELETATRLTTNPAQRSGYMEWFLRETR